MRVFFADNRSFLEDQNGQVPRASETLWFLAVSRSSSLAKSKGSLCFLTESTMSIFLDVWIFFRHGWSHLVTLALSIVIEQHASERICFKDSTFMIFHTCFDQWCVLQRFFLQSLMKRRHRREHSKSNQRRCEQMKYRDFEESVPSARLLH